MRKSDPISLHLNDAFEWLRLGFDTDYIAAELSRQHVHSEDIDDIIRKARSIQKNLKVVKGIFVFFLVMLVGLLPFAMLCEYIGGQFVQSELARGHKIYHEGFELIFLFGFLLYSVPFIIWLLVLVFIKKYADKYRFYLLQLVLIGILAALPAMVMYMLFFGWQGRDCKFAIKN